MQTFFSWLRNLSMRMSSRQKRDGHWRNQVRHKYGYDALEERRVLTIGLDIVAPPDGNLNADGEWEGLDPTVFANVSNVPTSNSFRIEIDQDGDGNADAGWDQSGQNTQVQFDPRSINPNLTGHLDVRLRASELNEDGSTVLGTTDWVDFRYNLTTQGDDNQPSDEGSGDEGSGEGDPPAENTPPAIDGFGQGEQYDDWYVFNGHVSGTYAAGGTVTVSGVLGDQSAAVDTDGNFSFSAYVTGGAQGYVYAQATDAQGGLSNQVSLAVNISAPTPPDTSGGEDGDTGENNGDGSGEEPPPPTDDGSGDQGSGDPGTGDPGTGDPGTGDPGTGDPGTGDPGTGDPGTGDPGSGDPGSGGDGSDDEGEQ